MTPDGTRRITLSWESAITKQRPIRNGRGNVCRPSGSGKRPHGGEDGREYPWGVWFDKKICNSSKAAIGYPTPVTQYSKGVSPYGCYDMAGNVWVWCADWYDEEKKDSRVIRGGSWRSNPENLRSSYRDWFVAVRRTNYIGFRLALDIP